MADSQASEPAPDLVVAALNALLQARDAAVWRLLEIEGAVLLHPSAEATLRNAAQAKARAGNLKAAEFFNARAELLEACRVLGLAEAKVFCQLARAEGPQPEQSRLEDLLEELLAMPQDERALSERSLVERQIYLCRAILVQLPRYANGNLWACTQGILGTALQYLGKWTGDIVIFQQAEEAYQASLLELTRERAPLEWATAQNNLGNVLLLRGHRTDSIDVLKQAEHAFNAALLEFDRQHTPMDWAAAQTGIGGALQIIGKLNANTAVLREAEVAHRAALLERTREQAPIEWAGSQNNLGITLETLGGLVGDVSILREAENALRNALLEFSRDLTPMDWAQAQSNLGAVLQRLGDLLDEPTLLHEARLAFSAALLVHNRENSPSNWAETQTNLGAVLRRLGTEVGDAEVLKAAEQAFGSALEVRTRATAPMKWAMTQINLGLVQSSLGKLIPNEQIIWQAVESFRKALEVRTRECAPMDWAITQRCLAGALRAISDRTGDASSKHQAEVAYRSALDVLDDSGAEDYRQETAADLVKLLVDMLRHSDAAAVIVPTLLRSDLAMTDTSRSVEGRARAVEQVGDLYGLLSLCRLRQQVPDVSAALVAAATGRARLLADALALYAVRLEEINDPEIRELIGTARDRRASFRYRLGYGPSTTDRLTDAMPRRELPAEEREQLQAELRNASDTYVALCREHGLIGAPEPLSLTDIVAAAPRGGALVLPVLTETAAFAFVVIDGVAEPTVVDPLPLDRRAVAEHLSGEDGWLGIYYEHFLGHALVGDGCKAQGSAATPWSKLATALGRLWKHFRHHRQDRDGGTARRAAEARWDGQLTATQAWLWERLLAPVHAHLEKAELSEKAPVVLLAPGLLGLLPLHAAGPAPDGPYFCDYWTVSYAPSIRALLTCRQRVEQRQHLPVKLLAVIDPPSDEPMLLGAQQEEPMLRRCFAHGEREILWREQATLAAVLTHLPTATYFHASTHGRHDPMQPRQSQLHLADTPLRLEMLHETRLEAARLVFLSTCESGLSGVRKLPEEFIGLPAGFIQAGAACVLGSLWPINDGTAFLLAGKFYERHLDEQGRELRSPAGALADAQDWLRKVTYGELKRMFPVQTGQHGSSILLSSTRMFSAGIDVDGTIVSEHKNVIHLPLGDDDDRPFVAPTHWAAFTVMGA